MVFSVDVIDSDLERYEDEARMRELRYLFSLFEDEGQQPTDLDYLAYCLSVVIDRTLRVLSWDDLGSEPEPVEANKKWLKALQSAMSYLRLNSSSFDTSLISKLKQTLTKYAEIRYPNFLVVIQPKLQLLNSIEA
jgi:hypothetical protein